MASAQDKRTIKVSWDMNLGQAGVDDDQGNPLSRAVDQLLRLKAAIEWRTVRFNRSIQAVFKRPLKPNFLRFM